MTKYLFPIIAHPILLPLGISYYSLMAVSYVVDVYGKKYAGERNIAKLALYMMWFPQMLQGPINRYDSLSKSLFTDHQINHETIKQSAMLFFFGAFKKYAIANVMIGTVGEIFGGDISVKPGGFLFLGKYCMPYANMPIFRAGLT